MPRKTSPSSKHMLKPTAPKSKPPTARPMKAIKPAKKMRPTKKRSY